VSPEVHALQGEPLQPVTEAIQVQMIQVQINKDGPETGSNLRTAPLSAGKARAGRSGRAFLSIPAAKICPLTPESSGTWQDAANFRSVGGAGSAILCPQADWARENAVGTRAGTQGGT
jgi:hypothetical protein